MASFTYAYKNSPYQHQSLILRESGQKPGVSLFLDPGLGKTFIIINNVALLFQIGKIDALLVIAPNNVHRNWASDEIPQHMPDAVLAKTKQFVWYSQKVKSKRSQDQLNELLNHKGLSILMVSYEASITPAFKAYAKKFFAKRRVFMALDESHRIKSATSKVKTTLVAMGKHAIYRRILSGTPIELPTDIYPQIKFILPDFWKSKGLPTKAEFDNLFCVTQDRQFGANRFKQVVAYKNLELLGTWLKETGYRLSLDDVGIHLPATIYSKQYHCLTSEQQRVYDELTEQCRTELASGDLLETDAAMTKLLRLQQIICGYVSIEAEQPSQMINLDGKNPRLECAVDGVLSGLSHQSIIFARFTKDIDQLMDALGSEAVRYDGKVDADNRAIAKKAFQEGHKKYIVMSDAGAEGLTLTGSKTMLFYSNTFSMQKRLQKEARQKRIGQNDVTHVVDMVCENTVDERIIDVLRTKREMADVISGRGLAQWI